MNLTQLNAEERVASCLNCKHHYKAKGVGLKGRNNTTHMCAKDLSIAGNTSINNNRHVRQKETMVTGVQTCEAASRGNGRCRSFQKKQRR